MPKNTRQCSIDGCDKVVKAMSWCVMHWTRYNRTGDPLLISLKSYVCQICGRTFQGHERRRKTCSPQCQVAYKLEYGRNYVAEKRLVKPKPRIITHYAECVYCRETFAANRRQFKYCSKACIVGDKRRHYYLKRKAALKAIEWEPFKNVEIFRRDGWICGLCGDPIDPRLPWPEPMSASLDHIIPISFGGPHLRANVQAAHLTCNCSKGNRSAA